VELQKQLELPQWIRMFDDRSPSQQKVRGCTPTGLCLCLRSIVSILVS
jgi:hypothetical protein